MGFLRKVRIKVSNIRWRRRNRHNSTNVRNYFDISRVTVGKGTYGDLYILMHNKNRNVKIGSYCSIAPNVAFIAESDHRIDTVSTFPFKAKCFDRISEAISKGDIIIDDDVWIGYGAVILSGVHIKQGAVIAAGSIVTKDVPFYAVVAGAPARIVKYRFAEEIRDKLKGIDYNLLPQERLWKSEELLYTPVTKENVDYLIDSLLNLK